MYQKQNSETIEDKLMCLQGIKSYKKQKCLTHLANWQFLEQEDIKGKETFPNILRQNRENL